VSTRESEYERVSTRERERAFPLFARLLDRKKMEHSKPIEIHQLNECCRVPELERELESWRVGELESWRKFNTSREFKRVGEKRTNWCKVRTASLLFLLFSVGYLLLLLSLSHHHHLHLVLPVTHYIVW
jgi:hypothetical protein